MSLLQEASRRLLRLNNTKSGEKPKKKEPEDKIRKGVVSLIEDAARLKQQLHPVPATQETSLVNEDGAKTENQNDPVIVRLTTEDVATSLLPDPIKDFLLGSPTALGKINTVNLNLTIRAKATDRTLLFATLNLTVQHEGQPTKGIGVELRASSNLCETQITYPQTFSTDKSFTALQQHVNSVGAIQIAKGLINIGNNACQRIQPTEKVLAPVLA